MKTQAVPLELRGFFSVFKELAYRWDYSVIFDDFLTLVMCCYAHGTEEETYFKTIKRYSKKELELFPKLMAEWLMMHSAHQTKYKDQNVWFDSLGTFYELILSPMKSKAFGQFFTPEALCDILVQLTYEPREERISISDPCCGSGRLLLAYDSMKPGFNVLTGADKDFICVKMTCLNLMVHGCVGEVYHMDTLDLTHYATYSINYVLKKEGYPSILRIKNEPPKEKLEEIKKQAEQRQSFVFDF